MSGAPKADRYERSTAYPSTLPGERKLREKEPFGPPPQETNTIRHFQPAAIRRRARPHRGGRGDYFVSLDDLKPGIGQHADAAHYVGRPIVAGRPRPTARSGPPARWAARPRPPGRA